MPGSASNDGSFNFNPIHQTLHHQQASSAVVSHQQLLLQQQQQQQQSQQQMQQQQSTATHTSMVPINGSWNGPNTYHSPAPGHSTGYPGAQGHGNGCGSLDYSTCNTGLGHFTHQPPPGPPSYAGDLDPGDSSPNGLGSNGNVHSSTSGSIGQSTNGLSSLRGKEKIFFPFSPSASSPSPCFSSHFSFRILISILIHHAYASTWPGSTSSSSASSPSTASLLNCYIILPASSSDTSVNLRNLQLCISSSPFYSFFFTESLYSVHLFFLPLLLVTQRGVICLN